MEPVEGLRAPDVVPPLDASIRPKACRYKRRGLVSRLSLCNQQSIVRSSPRRILMLTSVFPRWEGDATPPFVENLAVALAEAGWEVRILAPGSAGAPFRETVKGVTVIRFPYMFPPRAQKLCYEGGMLVNLRVRRWTRWLLPLFFIAQSIALLVLGFRYRPRLIHSHSLLPQGLSGALIARLLGCPHLTTSHGNDVFGLKATGLMGCLKRWVLRHADAVTVNSTATRDAVLSLGCDPPRLHQIPAMPNAGEVDPALAARLRDEWGRGPVILFVGRLIEEKGIGELIAAIAALRESWPEVRAVLAGDGADRARFERRVRNASLQNRVRFAGWIAGAEVASWMVAADVVVVPSKRGGDGWQEAQGLVAVEAMAVGTPVVASRLGGLVDMIEDGVTGYLCEAGSAPSLADALRRAMADPGREALVARARQLYRDRFGPAAVVEATEAVYHGILTGTNRKQV